MWNFDSTFEQINQTSLFQYRSISASVIRSINVFRELKEMPPFSEDPNLSIIALKNSLSQNPDELIPNAMLQQPYISYKPHFHSIRTADNAFTNLINFFTTDPEVSKLILSSVNAIGVGVYFSETDGNCYFSLIIGLRTRIGDSAFTKSSLRSRLYVDLVLEKVNKLRAELEKTPLILDFKLEELAFQFCQMDRIDIKLDEFIHHVSSKQIGFGSVPIQKSSPHDIIEEWMLQYSREEAVMGEYNRVGIAFFEKNEHIESVRVLVRDLHGAMIDGTEIILDSSTIITEIVNLINDFREIHSLKALHVADELMEFAQLHASYEANGEAGINPFDSNEFIEGVKVHFTEMDISHFTGYEISEIPKFFMSKWQNNVDCLTILLNPIDEIGIGVCFDGNYCCYLTSIIGSFGADDHVQNRFVQL